KKQTAPLPHQGRAARPAGSPAFVRRRRSSSRCASASPAHLSHPPTRLPFPASSAIRDSPRRDPFTNLQHSVVNFFE
ncbi:hypothetical protein EV363DRAFT_1170082, partial [Boletus edulis]